MIYILLIAVVAAAVVFYGIGLMAGSQRQSQLKTRDGMTIKRIVEETGVPVEQFTCYDCPLHRTCRSAFDPYNTNGDCLEAK